MSFCCLCDRIIGNYLYFCIKLNIDAASMLINFAMMAGCMFQTVGAIERSVSMSNE